MTTTSNNNNNNNNSDKKKNQYSKFWTWYGNRERSQLYEEHLAKVELLCKRSIETCQENECGVCVFSIPSLLKMDDSGCIIHNLLEREGMELAEEVRTNLDKDPQYRVHHEILRNRRGEPTLVITWPLESSLTAVVADVASGDPQCGSEPPFGSVSHVPQSSRGSRDTANHTNMTGQQQQVTDEKDWVDNYYRRLEPSTQLPFIGREEERQIRAQFQALSTWQQRMGIQSSSNRLDNVE